MQGCNKVTRDAFLLQAEQLQTTQPIATAEMLQPSDHLHGLLWTYSNRSKSFLCWGLKSWVQPSRWDLIWAGQGGRIPSLPAVYATGDGPRICGGFLGASTYGQSMSSLSSSSMPKPFSAGLLSTIHPQSGWIPGQPWPRYSTLHLSLLGPPVLS